MIYITSKSVEMTVLKTENALLDKIELVNQTDKTKLEFELRNEDVEYKKNSIIVKLSKIIPSLSIAGHYDYYIYAADRVIESGILQFENFDNNVESYNVETNIIQYNK